MTTGSFIPQRKPINTHTLGLPIKTHTLGLPVSSPLGTVGQKVCTRPTPHAMKFPQLKKLF